MIKQFIIPFFGMFILAIFVLLMQFLWKYIDDFVGKGLELSVIGEFFIYIIPHISTTYAFPLAMLLASIFTLGNLGENYELIALKSAGISLQRILFPLIITSILISIGAFFVANNVTPVAYLKWRTLIYDIQQQRPELHIPEGIFYNGIDGYSFRISKRDYKTNMMYYLRIYDHTERSGNVFVTLADSGRMMKTADARFLEVELYSGHSYEDLTEERTKKNKTYPFRHDFFERQVFRMTLPGYDLERSDLDIFKTGFQMLNLDQLTYMIDSLSGIIHNQENQLREIVKPAYNHNELKRLSNNEFFKILLCHRPELIDIYNNNNIDLVFTGHAHGGQIRLPFIGAIVAPDQGFFPKYTEGEYTKNNTTMIVSRGLGNTAIPFRTFNKPEIIEVTLSNKL